MWPMGLSAGLSLGIGMPPMQQSSFGLSDMAGALGAAGLGVPRPAAPSGSRLVSSLRRSSFGATSDAHSG